MRRARLLALGLLGGCYGVNIEQVAPPLRPGDGVQSVVLALEADELLEVYAVAVVDGALESPVELSRRLPPGTDVRIEALRYTRALTELGLPAGRLMESLSPTSGPLPVSLPVLGLSLSAQERVGTWAELSSRSQQLAGFRVERPPTACARFEGAVVMLDSPAQPMWGVEVEPGVPWLGLHPFDDDVALRLGPDGTTRHPLGFKGRTALPLGDGQVLLGTYDSQLRRVRLTPTVSLEQSVRLSEPATMMAIDGSTTASDYFALSIDGVLFHFDGTRAEIVYRTSQPRAVRVSGDVLWAGPAEALVTWHSEKGVVRVKQRDGAWTTTLEELPGAVSSPLTSAHTPLGVVVANGDGEFYVERGRGNWVQLAGSPAALRIQTIEAYGDGFVYGSSYGTMGQYVPAEGYCPLGSIGQQDVDLKRILVMRDGSLIAMGADDPPRPSYVWLRPR
jgi:hypothetical protein